jgi:pentatricopeptide repeat protein
VQPTLATYNSCIAACQREGEWRAASHLLNKMQSQDSIQPDAHAYGAVMACLAKANMVQETLALLGVSAVAFVRVHVTLAAAEQSSRCCAACTV